MFFCISDFSLSHPLFFLSQFSINSPPSVFYKMARSITFTLLALLGLVATNGAAAARKLE